MKHIVKQHEPREFAEWKALANEDWIPTYAELSGAPKRSLKHALMKDQGFLCCYCERRLTDADSHIEHYRPQNDPLVDPLDFTNLLCSCQNNLKKGDPRHCGNLKEDWFDPDLLISPLDPDCEKRLTFTGDGEIRPARKDDMAARETIERLGLGIPKLNDLRAKAIEPFLEESLTTQEVRKFVTGYLQQPGPDGKLGEFWSTIHSLFGGYATP
jgi:uncharacterized protein (TIGR02646 family)